MKIKIESPKFSDKVGYERVAGTADRLCVWTGGVISVVSLSHPNSIPSSIVFEFLIYFFNLREEIGIGSLNSSKFYEQKIENSAIWASRNSSFNLAEITFSIFDCNARIKNKLFAVEKKQDYIFTVKLNVSRVPPCHWSQFSQTTPSVLLITFNIQNQSNPTQTACCHCIPACASYLTLPRLKLQEHKQNHIAKCWQPIDFQ